MMGMSKFACVGGLALVLAACGGEKKEAAAAEEVPATLAAGLYEVTSEVTTLASTPRFTSLYGLSRRIASIRSGRET